ncbi:antitoxin [Spirochaetia bacterium]|nr:antitoxin [Spirochaetia bacterium]
MPNAAQIRPVSDLRNNFSAISRLVHSIDEPVYLTKNGRGDMVVMSIESYENEKFQSEVYSKLKEAEVQAKTTKKRYTHEEVMQDIDAIISGESLSGL